MQSAEPPWSGHMSSANSKVPATITILLTAPLLSAAMRSLELSAYREPGCSGGEGGDGGGEGGEGGEGGGGGDGGGGDGDGGNDGGGEGGEGGEGGWNCTTKDSVPRL